MPRQTRSQRRARRDAREMSSMGSAGSVAAAPPAGGAPPRPVASGGAEPEKPRKAAAAAEVEKPRRGFFGRISGFIGECAAELQKVEWPTQSQLVTGTTVVLIACIIVGFYLYLNDQLWQYVVHHFIL